MAKRLKALEARIYQQTLVDTYAKVGFAKLGACPRSRRSRDPRDVKTAITAADLLNDRVIPFFEDHGIPLCRVLTDRGSEYCGNPERYEYELYLAIENIDHSRTKTKSPQRHLRALAQDHPGRVLPRGLPQEALPQHRRAAGRPRPVAPPVQRGPHPPGPMVLYGKTPIQTFLDSLPIAREKLIDRHCKHVAAAC